MTVRHEFNKSAKGLSVREHHAATHTTVECRTHVDCEAATFYHPTVLLWRQREMVGQRRLDSQQARWDACNRECAIGASRCFVALAVERQPKKDPGKRSAAPFVVEVLDRERAVHDGALIARHSLAQEAQVVYRGFEIFWARGENDIRRKLAHRTMG